MTSRRRRRRKPTKPNATRKIQAGTLETLESRQFPGSFLVTSLPSSGVTSTLDDGLGGENAYKTSSSDNSDRSWRRFDGATAHRQLAITGQAATEQPTGPVEQRAKRAPYQDPILQSLDSDQRDRLLSALVPEFVGASLGGELTPDPEPDAVRQVILSDTPNVGGGDSVGVGARAPSQPVSTEFPAPSGQHVQTAAPSDSSMTPPSSKRGGGGPAPEISTAPEGDPSVPSNQDFDDASATNGSQSITSHETPDEPAAASAEATAESRDTVTLGFHDGLTNWQSIIEGGSEEGAGTVRAGSAILTEGDSFFVGLERTFVVPEEDLLLEFTFTDLNFDTSDSAFINDAFEASFLDDEGRPLVHAISAGRSAFFNITEGEDTALGGSTTFESGSISKVTVDLSDVPAGTQGTLQFRLVNNDSDTTTSVRILDVLLTGTEDAPPTVDIQLADDTAPEGRTKVR